MLAQRRLLGLLAVTFIVSVVLLMTAPAVRGGTLPQRYGEGDRQFEEIEINEKIVVYFHQRMLGDAIVEKDYIVYQFDKSTGELLDRKTNWRENMPDAITKSKISSERAMTMVKGEVQSATLYIISPESDVFPLDPCPQNPCWAVRSVEDGRLVVTIIDAVEGWYLGNGIPPPYTGFSLTGPIYWAPCSTSWFNWSENAEFWFNSMGYSTEHIIWPTEAQVMAHIQSWETAVFYELAHGGSSSFSSGCIGGQSPEHTTEAEIAAWIAGYQKMPFTFIGSCDGMCVTGGNSLSNAFRKGSTVNTTTVGYCGMSTTPCEVCWGYSLSWQDDLFYYMSLGNTVKDAFDYANANYPACASANCMRFAGDEDFSIVPVVNRMGCGVIANFTADATNGCVPLTVNFTDLSIGPVTSRKWYFGDGDSSTAQNPSHQYAATGTLTVTYEVSSADTCTDIEVKEDYITIPVGAVCRIEPAELEFGSVAMGDSLDASFTITNEGCDVLYGNISAICAHHSIVSGGGPYSIASAESLVVTVRFAPASVGIHNCWVYTGSVLCADVYVSGTCVLPPPACQLNPDTLDFGSVSVGNFEMLSFDIANTGHGILSGKVSESCEEYDITSMTDYFLERDQTHTVTIIFFPLSAGEKECTIETGSDLCSDVYCKGEGSGGTGGDASLPQKLTLYQNYPNPFNPTTTIAFWIPEKKLVSLSIFGVDGKLVKTLVNSVVDRGLKTCPWDGVDSKGNTVSSGVYFYQLETGGKELTKKMILLK